MSKAWIYTENTTAQTVAAGGTLALGSIVRRAGNDRCCNPIVNLVNNGITLNACGYYKVNIDVVDAPTAEGPVTVTLLQDGVPVQSATNTAGAASAATGVSLSAPIVKVVGCNSSVLTAVLTAGAGSVTSVAVSVVKL